MTQNYEVTSSYEAWRKADELFPTDYEKDILASGRAGYPIYRSTADGNISWISDLGTRLEVNVIPNENSTDCTDTILIWIKDKDEPEIEIEERWTAMDVMECCIRNEFYTAGDAKEYERMLNQVRATTFSTTALYQVAKDICDHSEEQTIENVMFCLRKEAVNTFYTIK